VAAAGGRPFWDAFVFAFGSQRMNHILLSKFQRTIEKRFAPAKLPGPWQGDDFYIQTPEGKRWAADFLYEVRGVSSLSGPCGVN
jgi:hypothetical protein